eukprot:939093_1
MSLEMLSVLALSIFTMAQTQYPPEQIHIAIGWTPDRMVFNWLTFDYPTVTWSRLDISTNPDMSNSVHVFGKEYLFVDPWDRSEINRTIHVSIITDLEASTRYYYKVGDIYYGQSDIYSFKTGPNAVTQAENLPMQYVIYGDLGVWGLSNVVDLLSKEAENEDIDTLIHVGDFAYDMYQEDGTRGDEFMNMVQPIAARVPYMVCPGNHEKYENFSHYSWRYIGQPVNTGSVWTGAGETPNNWYYSWNEGLIHWIAISTEIYFNYPWMIEIQWNWLQQDLITANNNRTQAPWIIIYGHKQVYCSDPYNDAPGGSAETLREGVWDSDSESRKYGLEQLFYEYGVDFYIAGHQHNYERTYPVYKGVTDFSYINMPATVYLLVGAAGAKHGLNEFKCYPTNNEQCAPWSASRLLAYGYSRFDVYNGTHINFQYLLADATLQENMNTGDVYESVWYVQENHGPFNEAYGYREKEIKSIYQNYTASGNVAATVKTVDLFAKFGYDFPRTVFDPLKPIPYLGSDKNDYKGIEG